MREIKFRGLLVDKSRFEYGMPAYYTNNESSFASGIEHSAGSMDEILPETLGQYTGLKDKNGLEIYEGDIVRYNFNNSVIDKIDKFLVSEVYLHELRNCYAVNAGTNANNDLWRYTSQGNNVVKVIGNIHENPELLKE